MSNISKLISAIREYELKYKKSPDIHDLLKNIEDSLNTLDKDYDGLTELFQYIQSQSDKGYLRILPVCPGDICYVVDDSEGVIERQLKVDHIEISQDGMDIWLEEDDGSSYSCFVVADFGDTLFSDYEEAQKRCLEIQSKLTAKIVK